MAPHFFGHYNSPSNLAKSQYPRLHIVVILRDLESPADCNALHHTATCRNVLQHTAKRCNTLRELESQAECNTNLSLQHTLQNTLQQTLSPQQTTWINPTYCCDTERSGVTCRLQHAFGLTATHTASNVVSATKNSFGVQHVRHRTSAQSSLYVSKGKNRYFTHMNKACRTWWISYIRIFLGHVTYMNESCHTYEWVMSHVWMSNVYVGMSHDSHMNEACHTWMRHDSHMNGRHVKYTKFHITWFF